MWRRTITERLIVDTTNVAFNETDRIASVRIRNIGSTGAATVLTGWSESTPNTILEGDSDEFNAGDNGILIGQLKVDFSGTGDKKALLHITKNEKEELCD
jgi:hypothetical protein